MIEVVAENGVFEFPVLPEPVLSEAFIGSLGGICLLVGIGVPFIGGVLEWGGRRMVVFGWIMFVVANVYFDIVSPLMMRQFYGSEAASAVSYDQPGTVLAVVMGALPAAMAFYLGIGLRWIGGLVWRSPAGFRPDAGIKFHGWKRAGAIGVPFLFLATGVLLGVFGQNPDAYRALEGAANAVERMWRVTGRMPRDTDELEFFGYKEWRGEGEMADSKTLPAWMYSTEFHDLEDGKYRIVAKMRAWEIRGELGRVWIEEK